jgi:3-deoxy-7-phosphoheptulonate synthase
VIVVMQADATSAQLDKVVEEIKALGYQPHIIYGQKCNVVGAVGDERGKHRLQSLEALEGVAKVVPILEPFKLAGREIKPEPSVVRITNKVTVGGDTFVVMAGPCSVEDEQQILDTAKMVGQWGAQVLRGGAFKPRTSPYSFQGLEEEGLKFLQKASKATGLPIVTEVMNPRDIELVARYADLLQIGARNMQNFSLLKEVGGAKKPVFLKRGISNTIKEFLMSAEYIMAHGCDRVILCERGIRTFENATRFTLDLNAIPVIKRLSHLPIVVDPSHGTGHWHYVAAMAKAAIAAGCDGLMVEVHLDPARAESDGAQSLNAANFEKLMKENKPYVQLQGRHL